MFRKNGRSKWAFVVYTATVAVLVGMTWFLGVPPAEVVAGFTETPPTEEPTPAPAPEPTPIPEPDPDPKPDCGPSAIRGKVTDLCYGEPATGMRVSINGTIVTTDSKGEFSLTGLPPGEYAVSLPDVPAEWGPSHEVAFTECDESVWVEMTYNSCPFVATPAPQPLLPETGGMPSSPIGWQLLVTVGLLLSTVLTFALVGHRRD